MSVADLKKYGQMIAGDEKVRARAKEIGIQNIEGQVAYGKELGLSFTANDVQALAKESGITGPELNEEDLQKVAGGTLDVLGAVLQAATVGPTMSAGYVSPPAAVPNPSTGSW